MYISPGLLLLLGLALWFGRGRPSFGVASPWSFIIVTSLIWWGLTTPYGQHWAHLVWTYVTQGPPPSPPPAPSLVQ